MLKIESRGFGTAGTELKVTVSEATEDGVYLFYGDGWRLNNKSEAPEWIARIAQIYYFGDEEK